MAVIWSILSYVAAFVLVLVVDLLFAFVVSLAFTPLLRLVRPLYPAFTFLQSCAATFVGIWLVRFIADATPLRASFLMIAVPALLTYRNDRERVQKVIAGVSGSKMMLARSGHAESYDQRWDLWSERCSLFGHVLGFALGSTALTNPMASDKCDGAQQLTVLAGDQDGPHSLSARFSCARHESGL
jgi:hypothetical protein